MAPPPLHSPGREPLLVDLYELMMGESYLAEGLDGAIATFEVSCRILPAGWGYLIAAGLEELIEGLERFSFDQEALAFLEASGLFSASFLERIADLRFQGTVRAMPEGTVFFPGEPILEVTAPLLQAQVVETTVLNGLAFPSLVAAKAARCVEAASGRSLVDFSLRRTQGVDAGLRVSRGSYLAGFDSTSNLQAGLSYGIPVSGTMAHSYIETFRDEESAFDAFTRTYPEGTTLLIDTYDTIEGARRAARVGRRLRDRGARLGGVRLDSGDLLLLSRQVRVILDEAGLPEVSIVVSGNLDEHAIARLVASGAPIDGFGVGTRLAASAEAPGFDAAYKLACIDGRPVMKLSAGKQTLPGRKQVWRRSVDGVFVGDLVSLADEPGPPGALPLLSSAMEAGVRVTSDTLEHARARAGAQRGSLADEHRQLDAASYPVSTSAALGRLAVTVSARASVERRASPR